MTSKFTLLTQLIIFQYYSRNTLFKEKMNISYQIITTANHYQTWGTLHFAAKFLWGKNKKKVPQWWQNHGKNIGQPSFMSKWSQFKHTFWSSLPCRNSILGVSLNWITAALLPLTWNHSVEKVQRAFQQKKKKNIQKYHN